MSLCVHVHAAMTRKGDDLPYINHPIAVFGLLVRWGADEDTCIAGLLHDVLEDVPDKEKGKYRIEIEQKFGPKVLEIVEGVTEQDKSLSWKERKDKYLEHLRVASHSSLLVSCADKTHNTLSLLMAYEEQGESVWERFNATKEEKLWYLRESLQILEERLEKCYVVDLHTNAERLYKLIGSSSQAAPIISQRYKVIVADNFHYMDYDYHYEDGSYDTLEEALNTCRLTTVFSVMRQYEEGIEPGKLREKYITFGLDPYIVSDESNPDNDAVPFSAWTFVTEELCANIIHDMKNSCLAKWKSRTVLITPDDKLSPEESVEKILKRWSA